ncbi:hypothetical protein [Psychrobacter sp. WY6]|uniref:hypothetical protein n=1 Tax=Psychrobacter sp. WY6 TaxID=2708350 RepID=UPI002022BF89|nr:hypothetical protein [Psychrobacter sp. WY6]
MDEQLKEVQKALNELPQLFIHGLLTKEEPNEAYHKDYPGFKKKLTIDDKHFTTDDLVDVLSQTPKGMIGGLLINFPDPITPKLLGDIIEADNAVILHLLSTDAGYVNGDAYQHDVALIDKMVDDGVIPASDCDGLKDKIFQKHFTYDYGFMQWVSNKPCNYHCILYSTKTSYYKDYMHVSLE